MRESIERRKRSIERRRNRPIVEANKIRDQMRRIAPLPPGGRLLAFEASTGRVLWQTDDDVFGTQLAVGREHGLLLMCDQTENYGGIRTGCWVNATPASGLVLMADAASWCTCSYLNQATIALEPAAR
jgi:hypothetical protein